MVTPSNSELILRDATVDDIPLLARHHRKMFEEIWENKFEQIDNDRFSEMETQYARKLQYHVPDDTCKAWVIEDGDNIIASGAVSVAAYVPTPHDSRYEIAFLHSMYTERDYRNRHCALRIVNQAISYCKKRGLKRVFLIASDAGRPIYKKVGFQSAAEIMKYFAD